MSRREYHSEVSLVQNPAFGSTLIWCFCRGFQSEAIGQLAPMTSLFVVLPIVLHSETIALVRSTQLPSGLPRLVAKMSEKRENLFAIHDRSLALRDLTFDSIAIGLGSRLIKLNYDTAQLHANDIKTPTTPERLRIHLKGAEKLGKWFGRLPQNQVFSLLRVEP